VPAARERRVRRVCPVAHPPDGIAQTMSRAFVPNARQYPCKLTMKAEEDAKPNPDFSATARDPQEKQHARQSENEHRCLQTTLYYARKYLT
jgi:hypothetical protein